MRATVTTRQSHPRRNMTVVLGCRPAERRNALARRKDKPSDRQRRESGGPPPGGGCADDGKRNAQHQCGPHGATKRPRVHGLPGNRCQIEVRQDSTRNGRQVGHPDERRQPLTIDHAAGCSSLTSGRFRPHADTRQQPVQRAVAERHRLDPPHGDRGGDPCQQPELGPKISAGTGQAEVVEPDRCPRHGHEPHHDQESNEAGQCDRDLIRPRQLSIEPRRTVSRSKPEPYSVSSSRWPHSCDSGPYSQSTP